MAKNVQKAPRFGALDDFKTPTIPSTHTHTDVHTDVSVSTPTTPDPAPPERKNRRVQLLMKESTVQRLDDYAKRKFTSRNDIIQNLVEEFLDKNGV